ncbi:MAG TPA: isoprenylcysteine carboxylmethyltransferase family protein [Opitutaceae bacterium]|nr:isoprenylcysteine carboxylmethyltransferase family protein [Opitutaceae bacterium]
MHPSFPFVTISPHLPPTLGWIFAASEIIISTKRATAARYSLKDRNSLRLLGAVIWSSVLLAVLVAYHFHAGRMPFYSWPAVAGTGLFACGIALRWYSILLLGHFFTVNVAIASDHRLIDVGPYRYLRHPSYTGALLQFLGLGLCIGNYASLALLLIPVFLAFRRRMEVEEAALTEAFGDDYRAYMCRTRRLVPFVY